MSNDKMLPRIFFLLSILIGATAAAQSKGACEFSVTALQSDQGAEASNNSSDAVKTVKTSALGSSIHWVSQEALERLLFQIVSIEEEFEHSSLAARQAEAKRLLKSGDSRIAQLSVSCSGINILGISIRWQANEPTIPFEPGRYPIQVSNSSSPQSFSAILSLRDEAPPTAYYVSEIGSIELQRFNANGASGSFLFVAENKAKTKKIKVQGAFEVPCKGDLCH